MDNLSRIRMLDRCPESTEPESTESWWFRGLFDSSAFDVIAFTNDNIPPHTFEAGIRNDQGKYLIELGVTLADFLPNLDGSFTYSIEVGDGANAGVLFISNSMVMGHRTDRDMHRFFTRSRHREFDTHRDHAYRLLPTCVAARFQIDGEDIGAALRSNLRRVLSTLVRRINKLVESVIVANVGQNFIQQPSYSVEHFHRVALAYETSDGGLTGAFLCPHALTGLNYSFNWKGEEAERLRDVAKSTADDPFILARQAACHLDGGQHVTALLVATVAAETCIGRFVEHYWRSVGVSGNAIKEADSTYSVNLRVHLPVALAAMGIEISADDLGRLNGGRRARNDFMHRGDAPRDRKVIQQYVASVDRVVRRLADHAPAAQAAVAPPTTTPEFASQR